MHVLVPSDIFLNQEYSNSKFSSLGKGKACLNQVYKVMALLRYGVDL